MTKIDHFHTLHPNPFAAVVSNNISPGKKIIHPSAMKAGKYGQPAHQRLFNRMKPKYLKNP
jgi:hypothetical protein